MMKRTHLTLCLLALLPFFVFNSCKEDDADKTGLIEGLWIQEKITEDGVEMALSNEEKQLSLLIESNGVYRTYAKEAVQKEHYGAWTITDSQWLELSADTWRIVTNPLSQAPANQWAKNHILTRFTLLSVSDNRLEIRLKTFTGNKKYSALFVEGARPVITETNFQGLDTEFKTLKTYIWTFKKSN